MVRAFPRGRTTEELLVLVGAGFSHNKRLAALAELDQLLHDRLVEKGADGRWRTKREAISRSWQGSAKINSLAFKDDENIIHAAAAKFMLEPGEIEQFDTEDQASKNFDPQSLLRYWRSALRADPRGATTQVLDTYGLECHSFLGQAL